MEVQNFDIPESLKPFIRQVSFIETIGFHQPKTFTPVVDGCPGLMIQNLDYGTIFREGKELPSSFLFGQSTHPTELKLNGAFKALCVFFQPHALGSLFELDAEILTDSCLATNMLSNGHDFTNKLEDTVALKEKVDILNSYLLQRLASSSKNEDLCVNYILSKIISSKGTYPLKQLKDEVHLSERSFERKFKQQVGISAKLFSRICRFQSSFQQFRNEDFNKPTDIAFENSYSDQSHFIRSFKEFAGLSPLQYQRNSNLITENLAESLG